MVEIIALLQQVQALQHQDSLQGLQTVVDAQTAVIMKLRAELNEGWRVVSRWRKLKAASPVTTGLRAEISFLFSSTSARGIARRQIRPCLQVR